MINIENLSFSYNEVPVLSNFSAHVKGGVTAVSAPSGAGKTTLLRLICGLETPLKGKITFDLLKNSGRQPRFSAVFQEDRLIESLSVVSNILPVTNKGAEHIQNILKRLELSDYANTAVKNLSGGQKRRVAVARAIACDYDIMLLDEPLNGLDADLKYRTVKTILDYNKGRPVVLVTHIEDDMKLFGVTDIINL